jgi:hypothetical protein
VNVIEELDRAIAILQALKGEAPAGEVEIPKPPSKWVNGKGPAIAPLGYCELELVDRLIAEFGEAPNGYKIPRYWFVPDTDLTGFGEEAQKDHAMNVAGASFNMHFAYSYKAGTGWFGKPSRVKDAILADCLAWNESLPLLEGALRKRIRYLLGEPPFIPNPHQAPALNSTAGYQALVKDL